MTPATEPLHSLEAIYQDGVRRAASLPPMSRETAQKIAPLIAAGLKELEARSGEEHVPAA